MAAVAMSWSGGKDCCFALYELQQSSENRVTTLLTTMSRESNRIGLHHVRRELVEQQAQALGIPLHVVYIPTTAANMEYEAALAPALAMLRVAGIEALAFGDLFLEDIRAYRDAFMARHGMRPLYPLWGRDTRRFARDFVARGFKAVTTCVDLRVLDASFVGRLIDDDFLADLPTDVDPCGENGEFHSFVYDGPNFRWPIGFTAAERIVENPFCFCELRPVSLQSSEPIPSGSELVQ